MLRWLDPYTSSEDLQYRGHLFQRLRTVLKRLLCRKMYMRPHGEKYTVTEKYSIIYEI